jgi:hypothetical protein
LLKRVSRGGRSLLVSWERRLGLSGAGFGFGEGSHLFSGIGVGSDGNGNGLPLLLQLTSDVEGNVNRVGPTRWGLIGGTVLVLRGGGGLGAVRLVASFAEGLCDSVIRDGVGGFLGGGSVGFFGSRFERLRGRFGFLRARGARALGLAFSLLRGRSGGGVFSGVGLSSGRVGCRLFCTRRSFFRSGFRR